MQKKQAQARFLAILLAAALAGMLLSLAALARSKVLRPIQQLQDGMDRVGSGDLGYRVDVRQKNEIGDLANAFNAMVGKLQDVTASRNDLAAEIDARKTAERALAMERAQLVSLFEGIDDVIYVADPETLELLYVNDAFTRAWGKDVIGKKCFNVLQGLDAPCPFCTNDKILGDHFGETHVWEFQNEVTKRWYRCADKGIRWANGRKVRFELASDITEIKQAEQRVRSLLADLRRSNQDLEQFAYVASRDLQEPLRMVASYTQLIEKRYSEQLDDAAREFIGFAVDGAHRMQALINDLLQYSSIGTRGKAFEPTDMNAVLEEVKIRLRIALEESGTQLICDKLPTVRADAGQMAQLLQNLVGNAVKFRNDRSPVIRVTVQETDKEWVFAVEDNGIGIDAVHAERIFVIFQRLHQRDSYPGTGIGLAVCKKIVERHGGTIRVAPAKEEGSVFTFTIPFEPPVLDASSIDV